MSIIDKIVDFFKNLFSSKKKVDVPVVENEVNVVVTETPLDEVIVLDGNSLSAGYSKNFIDLVNKNTVNKQAYTVSIAGQTTSQMILSSKDVDKYLKTNTPKHTLVAWEIRNAMVLYGGTVDYNINLMENYCKARRKAGYNKIAIISLLPSGAGFAQTWQPGMHKIVNDKLATRWKDFADVYVDLSGIPELQKPGNTKYFMADKIHLTPEGNKLVANAVYKALFPS